MKISLRDDKDNLGPRLRSEAEEAILTARSCDSESGRRSWRGLEELKPPGPGEPNERS